MIKDGNNQVNSMLKNPNMPSIQFKAVKGQPDEVTFSIEGDYGAGIAHPSIDWNVIDDYLDEDEKPKDDVL